MVSRNGKYAKKLAAVEVECETDFLNRLEFHSVVRGNGFNFEIVFKLCLFMFDDGPIQMFSFKNGDTIEDVKGYLGNTIKSPAILEQMNIFTQIVFSKLGWNGVIRIVCNELELNNICNKIAYETNIKNLQIWMKNQDPDILSDISQTIKSYMIEEITNE